MYTRPLTTNDLSDAARVSWLSFHVTGDAEKRAEHMKPENRWGCFTDEGELAASMVNNPYRVRYGDSVVNMGGIGGVSTLAEYRECGCIRQIFASLLRDAREKGEVFSSLYPFSHRFYRKFGYESADPRVQWTIPTALLRPKRFGGWVRHARETDAAAMLAVYDRFASDYRFMAVRDEARMAHIAKADPMSDGNFCYLLGEGAETLAYVRYTGEKADEGWRVNVRDMAYDGARGLRALLGFFGRLSAEYRDARVELPRDVPLGALTDEPYEAKGRVRDSLMVRLTNVPEALRLMPREKGTRLVLDVRDDFLKENEGRWLVDDEGARLTDEPADAALDQRTLALLLTGFFSWREALLRPDCETIKNRDALSRAFPGARMFLAEQF